MKKTILLAVLSTTIFLGGCLGQSQPAVKTQESTPIPSQVQQTLSQNPEVKEAYFFLDKKVMVFKNGQYQALDKEVTLSDGSVLSANGEVKKGATVYKLKEGQSITADGKVMEESKFK